MICKNCDNETGSERRQTCSDKCRQAFSRSVTCESVTLSVTEDITAYTKEECGITDEEVTRLKAVPLPGTLGDYHNRPSQYVERLEPDKLNWGEWMDTNELKKNGFKSNRVSIPGDWDYKEAG